VSRTGRAVGRVSPRTRQVVGAGVALGYGALVSFTRPFTWPADLVTAGALAWVAALTLWRLRAGAAAAAPRARGWPLWAALAVAVVGWELFCYVSQPRAAHPTLSTLIDMVDAHRAAKTLAGALWLALGWELALR